MPTTGAQYSRSDLTYGEQCWDLQGLGDLREDLAKPLERCSVVAIVILSLSCRTSSVWRGGKNAAEAECFAG